MIRCKNMLLKNNLLIKIYVDISEKYSKSNQHTHSINHQIHLTDVICSLLAKEVFMHALDFLPCQNKVHGTPAEQQQHVLHQSYLAPHPHIFNKWGCNLGNETMGTVMPNCSFHTYICKWFQG